MTFSVKEIYFTLQGEGANTGRPAVFLRFAGCNLWSGREEDRATAVCRFCDTDFVGTDGPGGGRFATADALASAVADKWPRNDAQSNSRLVVLTGGEPALQLDAPLLDALHAHDFEVAIETNGTVALPRGVDWVCVSPKAGASLVQRSGDELKLVYPQVGASPDQYYGLDFTHFFLQPMDGPNTKRNTELAAEYCLEHPRWRLSLQMHKILGIP
ncbi:MAG: 7-carboxy-7-deazaguanine synthase [Gemmatimonadales bacterium]